MAHLCNRPVAFTDQDSLTFFNLTKVMRKMDFGFVDIYGYHNDQTLDQLTGCVKLRGLDLFYI